MRRTLFVLSSLALTLPLAAQQAVRIYKTETRDGAVATARRAAAGDRAMIGVSTSSGSRRDTLGVLISSITTGGPAEKAGLGEGDRIQSINGVSLRVNRDDAGDDEVGGIMQRRLTRELGKVKVGDEVTLVVWHDGSSKTYKLKTVAADELMKPRLSAEQREDRPVIGIGFGLTGSKRDTAGVFVNSVTEDGPAEKAGIVEGDRIAAINGVSLKLSKDDLEDSWLANTRLNRLGREVAKAKPGDVVELTVVSAGRTRGVKVTLAKASSLKGSRDGGFTIFRSPDGPMSGLSFRLPPTPPAMPAMPHAPFVRFQSFEGGDGTDVQVQVEALRGEIERALRSELPRARSELERAHVEMQRGVEEVRRAFDKARVEMQAARVTHTARTVRM